MICKEGYLISIYGHNYLKDTLFVTDEPNETMIEELVKDKGAVRAFVTEGTVYTIGEDYTDIRGNLVERYKS